MPNFSLGKISEYIVGPDESFQDSKGPTTDTQVHSKAVNAPFSTLNDKKEIPKDLGDKIQRTLVAVDTIKTQARNTLDAFEKANKVDAAKFALLQNSLQDLVGMSHKILGSSEDADENDAQTYLEALRRTSKYLDEYKNTTINQETLHKFLEKQEVESGRKLLRDKELTKLISDTSRSLKEPFSNFLTNNIRQISQSDIRQGGAAGLATALTGPLAPLLVTAQRLFPQIHEEYLNIKGNLKSLKERFFGPSQPKSGLGEINKSVNVDKVNESIDLSDNDSQLEELVSMQRQTLDMTETEKKENTEFKNIVTEKLGNIETSTGNLDEIEENTKGEKKGLFSKILSGFTSLFSGVGGLLGKIAPMLFGGITKLLGGGGLAKIVSGVAGAFGTLLPLLTRFGPVIAGITAAAFGISKFKEWYDANSESLKTSVDDFTSKAFGKDTSTNESGIRLQQKDGTITKTVPELSSQETDSINDLMNNIKKYRSELDERAAKPIQPTPLDLTPGKNSESKLDKPMSLDQSVDTKIKKVPLEQVKTDVQAQKVATSQLSTVPGPAQINRVPQVVQSPSINEDSLATKIANAIQATIGRGPSQNRTSQTTDPRARRTSEDIPKVTQDTGLLMMNMGAH